MKVVILSASDIQGGAYRDYRDKDVVIVDGKIVKNRDGKPGAQVGRAGFIWDEEVSESTRGRAMNVQKGTNGTRTVPIP